MNTVFEPYLLRKTIQGAEEINKEHLAQQVNSLDDLLSNYSNVARSNRLKSNPLLGDYQQSLGKIIQSSLQNADENNVDVAKTITNYVRLKDQNTILQNNDLVRRMIKGSVFNH